MDAFDTARRNIEKKGGRMMSTYRILLIVLLGALLSSAAFSGEQLISGQANILWGDPPQSKAARIVVQVFDPQTGQSHMASIDPEVLEEAGGANRIDGNDVLATISSAEGTGQMNRIKRLTPIQKGAGISPILGNNRWVSLLCKYADIADEQETLDYFLSLYENVPGALDHYWQALSYNRVELSGSTASGWHVLPGNESDYHQPNGDPDWNLLFAECAAVADPSVDFSLYDGVNLMINGSIGCCAWGGGQTATLDGVTKRWGVAYNPPWAFQNMNILGHEMGHTFGLPHSQNTDGDTDQYDNAWDVMSSSWSYGVQDDVFGIRGKHTISFHKKALGWINEAENLSISGSGSFSFSLNQLTLDPPTHYRMAEIVLDSTRSFTVEVREPVGEYDGNLPGNAVLIHEIDLNRSEWAQIVDSEFPPADFSDGAGVMWLPGETFCSPEDQLQVKVVDSTAGVFQIQADLGLSSNCPPIAKPDVVATLVDTLLFVPAPGILANDRDQNLDPISAIQTSAPPGGELTSFHASGAFTFVPDPGFEGEAQFQYRAFDGVIESNESEIVIHVLPEEMDFYTGTGEGPGFYRVDNDSAWGVKFDLYMPTTITSMGGSIYGESGSIYAVIVPVDSGTDLPVDPTLANSFVTGVATPQPGVLQELEFVTDLALPPGRYALIMGSGSFGASGSALLQISFEGSDEVEFMYGDPLAPFFADLLIDDYLSFFVRGIRSQPLLVYAERFRPS